MSEYNLPDLDGPPIADDKKEITQSSLDNQNQDNSKQFNDNSSKDKGKDTENKQIDRGLFCVKNDILYNWISGKHLISTHVINSLKEKRSLGESNDIETVMTRMNKYIEKQFPDDINPNTEMQVRTKFRSPFVFYLIVGNKEQQISIDISYNQNFFNGTWQNFSFSSQNLFKFIDLWRINLLKYYRKKYNKTKLVLIKPPEKVFIDYQVMIQKD